MPPEAPPPPGLLPPHGLSRCFFRDMCLPPPDAVAGRGHAAGLQETDLQGVIKHGVETWPKNGCVSTLSQNWYLIIGELRILPWPHPDWFSCCQAPPWSREVFGTQDDRYHEITWGGSAVILVGPRRALSYNSPQARRAITARSTHSAVLLICCKTSF